MSRDNTPIWKDYNAMVEAHVYIKKNGEWVDTGRHFTAMPGQAMPSCYLNRIAEDYVKSKQPSFDVMAANSAYTETQPDAYQVFKTDVEEDEYGAYNDWSYEERSDSGHCQNAPINSHADARQILTYGRWGMSGDSITVKEMLQPIVKATPFLLHLGAEQTYGQIITIESNKVGELILPEWLTASETAISVGTNTIYVAPSENTGWDNREGNIIVKCEGYDTDYAYIPVVYVNQAGIVPYFNVSPTEQSVDWQSGMTYFLVNTNVLYSAATSQPWLTYSGSTPAAPHNYNVFFTVTANTGDDREASVTFTYQTSESTTDTKTVAVRQRHVPDLTINPIYVEVNPGSHQENIELFSEAPWHVASGGTWYSCTPSSGNSGITVITVSIDTNVSTDDRSGDLIFSNIAKEVSFSIVQGTGDKILYRSTDDNIITLYSSGKTAFGANIISHTYDSQNYGVILFDGPIDRVINAFRNVTKLKELYLPMGVRYVSGLVNGCSNVDTVEMKAGLITIGSNSFMGTTKLKTLSIPNTVKSMIGGSMFTGSGILECELPDSVEMVRYNIFYNTQLANTEYNNKVYYSYPSRMPANTHMTFEPGTKCIAGWAFFRPNGIGGQTGLTSVDICDSIQNIGNAIFSDCTNLLSLHIGSGFTNTYEVYNEITSAVTTSQEEIYNIIGGGSNISSITIDSRNTRYNDGNGSNCIIDTATNTLLYGCTTTVIPNTVTAMGKHCFSSVYAASNITGITIPGSVSSVCGFGSTYFSGGYSGPSCEQLEWVNIESGCTIIGSDAFARCTALSAVSLPDTLTTISFGAFAECPALASITIPESVTRIEGNTIYAGAFSGCTNLASINLPSGLSKIEYYCFEHCNSLESIIIPDAVQEIERSAFAWCSSLASVTLGLNLRYIRQSAFSNCTNLNTINFNNTKARWNSITKGSGWKTNVPATVVHCTDGDVAI